MRKILPLCVLSLLFMKQSSTQAVTPYTTCPNVNIAVARAGTNSDDTNHYYLYNVNNTTGAMTQVAGGPYKDPLAPAQNLQVNGIGVNRKDGFIYGLTNQATITTSRFLRLDNTYGVTNIGSIPSPTSPTGTIGLVNSAAGEVDSAGNYYFTAVTITAGGALDKLFLGKISNIQSFPASTGAIPVDYYEIDVSGANCSGYISTFTTDPINSGLRDFSYNAFTKTFFAYATFKPTGAANFSGKLLELRPVAGSSPLRYQLICNPVTNTHTTEVAGTLIDRLGRFTVLFTDGSFGVMNQAADGTYNGTYTQVANNSVTTIPNPNRSDMASCGQQTAPGPAEAPVTNCPANFIVARAGTNAHNQNPYFIYSLNSVTGVPTLLPGDGLRYPNNPSRFIQVNGVGINIADGFFYGLALEGTITTGELVRFDKNYGVELLGNVVPPTSPTGLVGFVNTAAGDMDRSNNYYFTGVTANPSPGSPSGLLIDKLFLGKIAGVSSLTGATNPVPQYFEIDYSDAVCADYIATLSSDPNNSGLKDLIFDPITNSFISYVTYKPTGAANFSGKVVELKPIAGSVPLRYKLTCSTVTNSHTAEVAGTLIDNAGNFLVLLTDGTIGKIGTIASHQYDGTYIPLNNTTGLPNPLRGDMASCTGPAPAPLPVRLSSFTANSRECSNFITWTSENEMNFNRYELEQSTDNILFTTVSTVASRRSTASTTYQVTLPAAGKQVFYRLKLIDNNGHFIYSYTLNVTNSCTLKAGFIVNPNPVNSQLNLVWYGMNAQTPVDIFLFNASGSMVSRISRTIQTGMSTLNINVAGLPGGAYWIKAVDTRNNEIYQSKFIKQ